MGDQKKVVVDEAVTVGAEAKVGQKAALDAAPAFLLGHQHLSQEPHGWHTRAGSARRGSGPQVDGNQGGCPRGSEDGRGPPASPPAVSAATVKVPAEALRGRYSDPLS